MSEYKTQAQRDAELFNRFDRTKLISRLGGLSYPVTNIYFPLHREVASKIDFFVPAHLTFKLKDDDKSVIELDVEWLKKIDSVVKENCSELEYGDFIERFKTEFLFGKIFLRHVDSLLEEFLFLLSIDIVMSELNFLLSKMTDDFYRNKFPGLTFREVLLHVLGIRTSNPKAVVVPLIT